MLIMNSCYLFLATGFNIFFVSTPVEFLDPVVEFQWSYINYTWESAAQFQDAVTIGKYIPENIITTAVKPHGDRIYIATPSHQAGVPFTLSYVSLNAENKVNTPLVPFPNSRLHREDDCSNLQNVHAMEIDAKGIMWVLDGLRAAPTKCPPKLQRFDLNNGGKLIQTYVFPNEICLYRGCFLNDIVVDQENHAYITDASNVDPGLVVYCVTNNTIGKFRDSSMFQDNNAPKAVFENAKVAFDPINGIAMSPIISDEPNRRRTVFYSSQNGNDLYSISIDKLLDFPLYYSGLWRENITVVGEKQGSTDGMMMDNRGNLYYTLTSLHGIGKWNIDQPFNQSEIFYRNNTMNWSGAFGMDEEGHLYVTGIFDTNNSAANVNSTDSTSDIKFKIIKFTTGTKSYLYP